MRSIDDWPKMKGSRGKNKPGMLELILTPMLMLQFVSISVLLVNLVRSTKTTR